MRTKEEIKKAIEDIAILQRLEPYSDLFLYRTGEIASLEWVLEDEVKK